MNVTGKTKIFRKDFDGRPAYSRAISSQEYKDGQKGKWIREYESVQFPIGTQIEDGTIVNIKKSFEGVYESRSGEVKRKLIVQEFDIDDDKPVPADGFKALQNDDIPF